MSLMSIFDRARDWAARRIMQEPETFVEGGGNTDDSFHERFNRTRENLDEFESIYERGGPVAQLIDTRALMAFGTGVEFVSDDDRDIVGAVNGEQLSVTEWLDDAFDNLDDLLVQIGKDAYIYGDALGEIVENESGEFDRVELVNPKTMSPEWNDHGTIQTWEQEIKSTRGQWKTRTFDPDAIAHLKLHRVGRRPIGISLIEQNYDEIQRFASNQEAVQNALQLHGFPKYHIKVGKPDSAQVVNDPALRRVRKRFRNFDEKTNWVTGRDIDIGQIDTGETHIEGITEHDLMVLAAGFGVPEEMAGLGRGSTEATAKVRLQSFERMARSEQRILADQFIEQVVRPVIARYSPFPRDIDLGVEFGDVVSDQTATAEWLAQFREYYTVDEVREKLGDTPAPDDADLGPPEGAMPDAQAGGPFGMNADDQTADASASPDDGIPEPSIDSGEDIAMADGGKTPTERVYVSDRSNVPDGRRLQSDDSGGLFYERPRLGHRDGSKSDTGRSDDAGGERKNRFWDGY